MGVNELPRSLSIAGRTAEEDMGDPALLVKEGSGTENFQLTTGSSDRVLGYTKTGLRSGQHGAVVTAVGSICLLHADGAISQGDELAPSGAGGSKAGYVTTHGGGEDTFVGFALQAASDNEEVKVLFLAGVDRAARSLSVSTGSEGDVATDAFDVDFTQNIAAADDWLVEVYDDNMDPSSNVQISSQGSGSLQTSASQDSAIARLHTDGTETLRFKDSSGTLAATVHVVCTPLEGEGEVKEFDLTYS